MNTNSPKLAGPKLPMREFNVKARAKKGGPEFPIVMFGNSQAEVRAEFEERFPDLNIRHITDLGIPVPEVRSDW